VFDGFSTEMIELFLMLRLHNDQAFFAENRALYQRAARQSLRALAVTLGPTPARIDPQLNFENVEGARGFDLLASGGIVARPREGFTHLAPLYRWTRGGQADKTQ
jgi:hypothetical protein